MLAKISQALTQVLHAEDAATLTAGARQAYALTFGVTALLGLLLGLLALWWQPEEGPLPSHLNWTGLVAWLTTGAALAGLTLWFSAKTFARELTQADSGRARRLALLASAFGLASAPTVPWLMACANFSQPLVTLALMALTALAFALGWRAVGRRAALILA